ncbi:hypothetical protein NDN08_002547 [Rhodosorus marinus]|uniref:Uncharacterized protein n=1 Tax=Rhodosorus marinus TaxID=101924 RepID=A0AAV8UXK0_9RHOD|nr:hypothetical protein NDN08_002547 [Rhodosorus marinus]
MMEPISGFVITVGSSYSKEPRRADISRRCQKVKVWQSSGDKRTDASVNDDDYWADLAKDIYGELPEDSSKAEKKPKFVYPDNVDPKSFFNPSDEMSQAFDQWTSSLKKDMTKPEADLEARDPKKETEFWRKSAQNLLSDDEQEAAADETELSSSEKIDRGKSKEGGDTVASSIVKREQMPIVQQSKEGARNSIFSFLSSAVRSGFDRALNTILSSQDNTKRKERRKSQAEDTATTESVQDEEDEDVEEEYDEDFVEYEEEDGEDDGEYEYDDADYEYGEEDNEYDEDNGIVNEDDTDFDDDFEGDYDEDLEEDVEEDTAVAAERVELAGASRTVYPPASEADLPDVSMYNDLVEEIYGDPKDQKSAEESDAPKWVYPDDVDPKQFFNQSDEDKTAWYSWNESFTGDADSGVQVPESRDPAKETDFWRGAATEIVDEARKAEPSPVSKDVLKPTGSYSYLAEGKASLYADVTDEPDEIKPADLEDMNADVANDVNDVARLTKEKDAALVEQSESPRGGAEVKPPEEATGLDLDVPTFDGGFSEPAEKPRGDTEADLFQTISRRSKPQGKSGPVFQYPEGVDRSTFFDDNPEEKSAWSSWNEALIREAEDFSEEVEMRDPGKETDFWRGAARSITGTEAGQKSDLAGATSTGEASQGLEQRDPAKETDFWRGAARDLIGGNAAADAGSQITSDVSQPAQSFEDTEEKSPELREAEAADEDNSGPKWVYPEDVDPDEFFIESAEDKAAWGSWNQALIREAQEASGETTYRDPAKETDFWRGAAQDIAEEVSREGVPAEANREPPTAPLPNDPTKIWQAARDVAAKTQALQSDLQDEVVNFNPYEESDTYKDAAKEVIAGLQQQGKEPAEDLVADLQQRKEAYDALASEEDALTDGREVSINDWDPDRDWRRFDDIGAELERQREALENRSQYLQEKAEDEADSDPLETAPEMEQLRYVDETGRELTPEEVQMLETGDTVFVDEQGHIVDKDGNMIDTTNSDMGSTAAPDMAQPTIEETTIEFPTQQSPIDDDTPIESAMKPPVVLGSAPTMGRKRFSSSTYGGSRGGIEQDIKALEAQGFSLRDPKADAEAWRDAAREVGSAGTETDVVQSPGQGAVDAEETTSDTAEESTASTAEKTTASVAKETTASVAQETTASVSQETTTSVAQEASASAAQETTASVARETTASIAPETTSGVPQEWKQIAKDLGTSASDRAPETTSGVPQERKQIAKDLGTAETETEVSQAQEKALEDEETPAGLTDPWRAAAREVGYIVNENELPSPEESVEPNQPLSAEPQSSAAEQAQTKSQDPVDEASAWSSWSTAQNAWQSNLENLEQRDPEKEVDMWRGTAQEVAGSSSSEKGGDWGSGLGEAPTEQAWSSWNTSNPLGEPETFSWWKNRTDGVPQGRRENPSASADPSFWSGMVDSVTQPSPPQPSPPQPEEQNSRARDLGDSVNMWKDFAKDVKEVKPEDDVVSPDGQTGTNGEER